MKISVLKIDGFEGVEYFIYVLECTSGYTLVIHKYEHSINANIHLGSFEYESKLADDVAENIGDNIKKISSSFDELPNVVKALYEELNC